MKTNMHLIDRIARIAISIAAVLLYFFGYLIGPAAIIAGVFAGVFTITSLIGFCPIYALFGLNKRKKEQQ